MTNTTSVNREKTTGINIEDLVRFMRNQGRALGISGTVMKKIKMENGDHIRLSFSGDTALLEIIRRVTKRVAACIETFTEQDLDDIGLAVDEACTNVIQHSCAGNDACAIQLRFKIEADRLSIRLTDNGTRGQGFDPGSLPPVDMESCLNTLPKGGFGVHLIKRVMDKVHYSAIPGADNALTMVKYAYSKHK